MDNNISNYLLQTINRCAHTELSVLQLVEIRKIANILGVSTAAKRKDALIDEIARTLSAAILRSHGTFSSMAGGFPVIDPDNELAKKHPIFRKIIEKYNAMTGSPMPYGLNQQSQFVAQNPMMNLLGLMDPFQNLNSLAVPRYNPNPLLQLQLTKSKQNTQSCICGYQIYTGDKNAPVQCTNVDCSKFFHSSCCRIKAGTEEAKSFECPECTLKRCDPLHEVLEVLRAPFKLDNTSQEFLIDQNCFRKIQSDANIGVEIRCIRFEEKSWEQTWPHQGELYLNSKRETEFKPLLQNSSLKKRRDEKFFTRAVYPGVNSLMIKYIPRNINDFPKGKPVETDTFFSAIYVVQKLTCEELIAKLQQNHVRRVEDCKALVKGQLKGGDIEIDKVNYPLTCVLDMQILKTPAKGMQCKHPNCFSLENFVGVWFKNNQRKWQCPICKGKAYDIVIDSYFQSILKEAEEKGILENENPEVTIDQNADFFFNPSEKESKNKAQENNRMVPELTSDLKSEISKNSQTGKSALTNSAKKAKDEPNKNPVAILLDSDEELQPAKSNASKPQHSEPLNLVLQNSLDMQRIGSNNLNKNEGNLKSPFEETKTQKSSDSKRSKQLNKPEFSNATLQNPELNLAALKGDSNALVNLANTPNQARGIADKISPQIQGLSGFGSNGQGLNPLNTLQGIGRNWIQGQGNESSSMEVEMQDDYQAAFKRQLLLQQAGGQMNPNLLESLASGLYPGLYGYSKPTLPNAGFGLGAVNSEQQLLLNLLQSNLAQQQQQQLQQQLQQQMYHQIQQQQFQQLQQQQYQALLLMQQQQQQKQNQQNHQNHQNQQNQQNLQNLQTLQNQQNLQQALQQQVQVQPLVQQQATLQLQIQQKAEPKPQTAHQVNPQQIMETEMPPLQKERKDLSFSLIPKPENVSNLMSLTKESIASLMQEAEKDGDVLTYEIFSTNKHRKMKKAEKRAITTKKKLLSSVYKYLDDDLKQTIGTKGDITIRRKKKKVAETDKENGAQKSDDKMQIEGNEAGGNEQAGMPNGNHIGDSEKRKSKLNAQKTKKPKNKAVGQNQKEAIKTVQQELSNETSRETKHRGQVSDPICLD